MNDLEIGRQTKNVLDSMIEYIGYWVVHHLTNQTSHSQSLSLFSTVGLWGNWIYALFKMDSSYVLKEMFLFVLSTPNRFPRSTFGTNMPLACSWSVATSHDIYISNGLGRRSWIIFALELGVFRRKHTFTIGFTWFTAKSRDFEFDFCTISPLSCFVCLDYLKSFEVWPVVHAKCQLHNELTNARFLIAGLWICHIG